MMLVKPKAWVYIQSMPTVLRSGPFVVKIYTHDHSPAHVHVVKDGTVVVINLATKAAPQSVRDVHGMRDIDVNTAFKLVAANADLLLTKWSEIHG